jgi:hydroxyethylthiazole kinase-like uncharacterized protein yjeF
MTYITSSILKFPRNKASHKGDNGKVLVVGGSEEFVGAPALAAGAAEAVLRSGADLVTVAAPNKVAWVINTLLPDIITAKLPGTYFTSKNTRTVQKLAASRDVMLIGPGIGLCSNAFIKAITKLSLPKVIDADTLKAVNLRSLENSILTPHAKEFEILLKNSKLTEDNFKKHLGNNVILLKGRVDHIISKNKIAKNKTGNAVMTKGGTGDVLAGLAAGFVAQQKDKPQPDIFKAACMAAYVNGKTGDYLLKKQGRTFIASDILKNIHKVYIESLKKKVI